jgi:hypothetical protein
MQERKYQELEDRASQCDKADAFEQLKARARVIDEIAAMKAEGKALTLTDEEMNMLQSFRRFKLRMKKNGEVFKWQTRVPEGITLAEETGLIVHPQEIIG